MNRTLPHTMLVANAGSGKTYSLTTRMVSLLALGVEPRKIAALTFTKKAAGEFLDAVFERLAGAAMDATKLERLRADTGHAALDAAACRTILRRVADQMGGLSMGTIDSLFARIARVFPLESGISGEFAILGTAELGAAREEALAAVFQDYAGDPGRFAGFLDLVRRQSRRQSERDGFGALLEAVGQFHETFLRTPPGLAWGEPASVWPAGAPILAAGEVRPAAEALDRVIRETHPDLAEAAEIRWREGLEQIAALEPGQAWSEVIAKFFRGPLVSITVDRKTGDRYIPTGNAHAARVYLHPPVERARTALVLALARPEIEALLRRSAALHALMARFEERYDLRTRGRGSLTFSDITELLARRVEDPAWLASAGYRLDTRFDHWLLDEFQDTSRAQWKVLSSFIDEVVQDAGGNRSLFYVGDTKQAIYLWRGGDPGLFFDIRDRYNQGAEDRIRSESLAHSYRSVPEIVRFVNDLFGDIDAVAEPLGIPRAAADRWKLAWREHLVSDLHAGKQGHVRWIQARPNGAAPEGEEEEDEGGAEADPQDLEALAVLREIEPWKRGWSCAVLARTNDKAARVAGLLQARGIPVAVEGKTNPCTDNPLGVALGLAFRVIATPGDGLAAALLAGSPLAARLAGEDPDRFRETSLRRIASDGFAATARAWIEGLDLSAEPFLETRAAAFLAAASAFDARRGAGEGVHAFLDFIAGFEFQDVESPDVVRVMTVHQAKGLTFDMSLVTGLDAPAKDRSPGTLHLSENPPWCLLLPKPEFAALDPVLAQARDELQAENRYGELCTAYVALTRSRHALYVITRRIGEKSTSRGFARMLQLTLPASEGSHERGDPRWFEARPVRTPEAAGAGSPARIPALPPPVTGTPRPDSPSSDPARDRPAPGGATGMDRSAALLGQAVHAALARIEWIDADAPEFGDLHPAAEAILRGFLASERGRALFARPPGPCLLWRERAFEVRLDGEWLSGVFDRVLVLLEADGTPVSARIDDFKTDRGSESVIRERYAAQMEGYRRAAASLLGLPLEAVTARTVAVRA